MMRMVSPESRNADLNGIRFTFDSGSCSRRTVPAAPSCLSANRLTHNLRNQAIDHGRYRHQLRGMNRTDSPDSPEGGFARYSVTTIDGEAQRRLNAKDNTEGIDESPQDEKRLPFPASVSTSRCRSFLLHLAFFSRVSYRRFTPFFAFRSKNCYFSDSRRRPSRTDHNDTAKRNSWSTRQLDKHYPSLRGIMVHAATSINGKMPHLLTREKDFSKKGESSLKWNAEPDGQPRPHAFLPPG